MKSNILTLTVILVFGVQGLATAQACVTRTGNNASLFLDKTAWRSLNPGEVLRAYGEAGCVGRTVIPSSDESLALALTVWGDDEITPETDGMVAGELVRVTLEKPATTMLLDTEGPFADNLTYAPDRLWRVTFAEFDTTTTRRLDSLRTELLGLESDLDSLFAQDSVIIATLNGRVDSLEEVVDTQLANIQDLQFQLSLADARADSLQAVIVPLEQTIQTQDNQIATLQSQNAALQATVDSQAQTIANLQSALAAETARADSLQGVIDTFPDVSTLQARIAELEADLAATNEQLSGALELLTRIKYIVSRQGNKYKEICQVLGC